jgi:signal transduction histidine kinase/CheY-like chemotaxis protein
VAAKPSRGKKRPRTHHADSFARLFEAVQEGVYIGVLDAHATTTLAANPHLRLMFGYGTETPSDDVRPFDPDRFVDSQARDALIARLKRDRAVSDYLLRLRRADSAAIWVEVTAHVDPDPSTDALRIQALVRDVSERKKLEHQARDLYHQLVQAEKLAALGQTISGVAHELNNPLATILTWAERLASKDVDEGTGRGLQIIRGEAERSARIVRNLLTFARKRQTTRATVDVNQIVRDTLALRTYEQQLHNVTTIDALASGLPQVFADPHQLKQVLLNLVINAEQATASASGRGTIILRSWYELDRDSVVIEVSDDGPGVPEDVQTKIFDPFFTTKEVGQGTGLGLAVAYAIVEEHGGRLTVGSGSGRGATFLVELPVSSADLRPVGAPAPDVSSELGAGSAALVVEDEEALGSAVAEALGDVGFTVDRAGDGEEALERVKAKPYDLIVCDLKMPRLDGTAFYRTIAVTYPALARRIVFVTGDVAGTETGAFLEQSGCRWLAKPFRLRDLLQIAREIVE